MCVLLLMVSWKSESASMDRAAMNWETIRSIRLHDMTAEELVSAEDKTQTHLHYSRGVWWEEVKPFFYHPAVPLLPIEKGASAPSPLSALGGYYHFLSNPEFANGTVTVNEIPVLRSYTLEALRTMVRHNIRRGLRRLRIAKVTELGDLLGDGYEIYMGWERRHPDVRVNRSSPVLFQNWIKSLYKHPYKLIVGAYDGDRLVSFIIGQSVMGTANISNCFTHPDYYKLTPNTALVYTFITMCQQNPAIQRSCHGLRSLDGDLAQFKENLGYKQVTYPAYISIPSPIRPLVRWLFPVQYRRLMGQYGVESNGAAAAKKEQGGEL
jgi:hypothetical protein